MTVTTALAPPATREMLLDERGDALRASWHGEEHRVVLSLWRGDTCRATFGLGVAEAARLSGFLLASVAEAAVAAEHARAIESPAPSPLLRRLRGLFSTTTRRRGVRRGAG